MKILGMDKTIRRLGLFTLGVVVFAVLWRLFFDEVSGLNRRRKEQNKNYSECQEIATRIACFYRSNHVFPKTTEDVTKFRPTWGEVPPASVLDSNYTFHFVEAEKAVRAGKTNVPVVFEKLRLVGRSRGGLIGFVSPTDSR